MLRRFSAGCALVLAAAAPAFAASPAVQAAETSVYLDAGFLHTQYHENLSPGDDESGLAPGFGVGASVLLPMRPASLISPDFYAALNYDFNAGNIGYAGHYEGGLRNGEPADATDSAVFNRLEVRLGIGFPLAGAGEVIPFIAGGYQAWNRNLANSTLTSPGEFYHTGLFGGGIRFDQPVYARLVASLTGELLGLAGGGISSPSSDRRPNFSGGFGVTPEERVELGLDDALRGRIHVFVQGYWEHFNYSGTPPEYYGNAGYAYEPFSTTTQFGLNIGVGYHFD